MKLFETSNIEIVQYCQTVFGCELPSVLLVKRYETFIENRTWGHLHFTASEISADEISTTGKETSG